MAKAKKTPTWNQLEILVKKIASHLYDREALAEQINGVNCDCVIKLETDNWVIIETTEEHTLSKLRIDLAKFASIKTYLMTKNIYAKTIFITKNDPNPSLVQTGNGNHVEVISIKQFSQKLFNYSSYSYSRMKRPFGSAINPYSGENDIEEFTPVTYIGNGVSYTTSDITELLLENKNVVLLGNYGTGKSRCIQEIFNQLLDKSSEYFKYPIAINLKDNWGLKRSSEIISRHLSDLGLSDFTNSLLKLYQATSVCFLLDGFDEIGAQTWSDNPDKLKEIRAQSLLGVNALVQESKGGVLIVGREHYFNSEEELISCLGLKNKNPILLYSKDEFSPTEIQDYFSRRKINFTIPEWLPRRPLICQVLIEYAKETDTKILESAQGELEFWDTFIDILCEREAKIRGTVESTVVKNVLMSLARKSRSKSDNVGPISISEINKTFEECAGFHATDETTILLQRLPGLGRIGTESLDRQFIDIYLLDGLRAEDLVILVNNSDFSVEIEKWKNPLTDLGLRFVASKIISNNLAQLFLTYISKFKEKSNFIILGDLLGSLAKIDGGQYDFQNKMINNSNLENLDLSVAQLKNLKVSNTWISTLSIGDNQSDKISFDNCLLTIA
ncbi:NACHT domain protein [Leptospira santarosai str. ST188]|uniref:hypothetical protein n=1 Tax=Leptospira santarosai TaxID=28183 RepID=UPI0002BB9409|nr:hypothetical protein [Leptospira santarosai]EMF89047.1 NACHT domain protein [Leptospira santarosai str. ST188]